MFSNTYKNKKVLITGNTGFKGSWLTIWLIKLGAKVYGASDDVPTTPSMFRELNIESSIEHVWLDIRNKEKVIHTIKEIKPDFIFHLAAQALVGDSYVNPIDTLTTNIMGTANVLEALRILDCSCVAVMITSDKSYDNVEWPWGYKETDKLGGKDIYSGSKGGAELIIKSYFHSFFENQNKIKLCSVRAGNVVGGGDWAKNRIVPDCMRAWDKGEAVEIRSPNSTRPWQFVLEPLSGYLNIGQLLFKDGSFNGECFNFGPLSHNNHNVQTLLRDLSKYWGFKNKHKAFEITGAVPFHEAGLLKLNCDKALLHLKWMPTLKYEELIEFTGLWYFEFYKKNKNLFSYTIKQLEKYESIAIHKKIKWTE